MRKKAKNAAIAIKNPIELKRMQSYLKSHNYKAYVLFMIGLGTGYRGEDLIKLTVGDIREALITGELEILEDKTKDTRKVQFKRVVYLNSKLMKILDEYIKNKDDSQYLYWSQRGSGEGVYKKNIRRDSLGKIFKKATIACGIANVSVGTHTPRKTYGYIQYIKNDKDIYFVQELFGHSSPRITKDYIGIDDDMMKESAKNMDEFM